MTRIRHAGAAPGAPAPRVGVGVRATVGGSFLSTRYYPTEVADLISGIIIYLCAFSMLFRS